MSVLNDSFLEAYKQLDKLCREMYKAEKGVTSYIDDMKTVSVYESRSIPGWAADQERLIRLRHLRNQLSHELGTLRFDMCSQSDIDWLKDFYQRILDQRDPLSMLHVQKELKKTQAQANPSVRQPPVSTKAEPVKSWQAQPKHKRGCATALLAAACFISVVCLILAAVFTVIASTS